MLKGTVIAAGHPLTAQGAAYAIEAGGNAFDAAVSGWLVSCLAEPVLTSPGGGGFAMASPAGGKIRLYDFFTQTPLRKSPDAHAYPLEADFGSTRQVFHLGAGSMATPGCVAGLLLMHRDLGKIPLKECAAPAMDLAKSGLPVTDHAARLFKVVSAIYSATPESCALFESVIEPGRCLMEGETFHNPAFAHFLEMLIAEGSRWFYEGDIGRLVDAHCRANGGHLQRDDFVAYTPQVREPLNLTRNGATIHLNPPPSMGGTLVGLGLFLNPDSGNKGYPFNQQAGWLDWIEPLRLMSLVRSQSAFENLDKATKEKLESMTQESPDLAAAASTLLPHTLPEARSRGTTQISIIDSDGNEISMTTSNGSGSAVIMPEAGFMMNNMLGEEDLQTEGVGSWRTNKRLASMMCPTLVRLGNGTHIATGSGGSNRIRSTLLQILRHVIDRDIDINAAVQAPRLHWESDEVHAEEAAHAAIRDSGTQLPWTLIEHTLPNLFFGGAHSVSMEPDGRLQGIGDPRRGGVALQVHNGRTEII